MLINPVDQRLAKRIKGLENRLKLQGLNDSVLVGDWLVRNGANYTYTSSTTATLSNNEQNLLSVGDRVRWKQAGDSNYRYGYIGNIASNVITILGGTDYSIDNLAFEEFGIALNSNPSGHPQLINWDADIRAASGGSTYSNLNPSAFEITQFYMQGPLLFMRMDVTFGSMSGGASSLNATPPYESNFLTYERRIISTTNNFNFTVGLTKMGGSNLIEIYTSATTLAGFSNTTNGLGFNISLEYVVDN